MKQPEAEENAKDVVSNVLKTDAVNSSVDYFIKKTSNINVKRKVRGIKNEARHKLIKCLSKEARNVAMRSKSIKICCFLCLPMEMRKAAIVITMIDLIGVVVSFILTIWFFFDFLSVVNSVFTPAESEENVENLIQEWADIYLNDVGYQYYSLIVFVPSINYMFISLLLMKYSYNRIHHMQKYVRFKFGFIGLWLSGTLLGLGYSSYLLVHYKNERIEREAELSSNYTMGNSTINSTYITEMIETNNTYYTSRSQLFLYLLLLDLFAFLLVIGQITYLLVLIQITRSLEDPGLKYVEMLKTKNINEIIREFESDHSQFKNDGRRNAFKDA
jgi:hypothetical protein